MKQVLADYLNAEAEKTKAAQRVQVNTLSFKGILTVKDVEAGKEAIRTLIDLGFTFESNKAYISHLYRGVTTTTVIDVAELLNERILWTFNFIGGGWNAVTAVTLEEAIQMAKEQYESVRGDRNVCNLKVDVKSFRSYRTKKDQSNYYKNQPLMD